MRYIKIFLILLLFSTYSAAQVDEKDFFINLSIDKNITSSQNAGTSAAFSALSGLAYLSSKYDMNKNFFYRLGFGYSVAMITLLNHELSGHGLRALEFNCKPHSLEINPLPISGSIHTGCTLPIHIQKDTMLSLGGMQANYLLAQKISDNFFVHEQEIDPVIGIGYILSAADQIEYNYINHNNKSGHDVNNYVEDMEIMYGNKSMNRSIIKSHGFLSLLDPILFASVYSAITGRNVNVPVLSIGNIGVTPFARSIFTPYGVIEKKFGAYITTDYTPIKVGFSVPLRGL
uniref:Uncharacterized protein n=1 Tax=Wolbachia endosymbiont of Aleurodicus dispersus TaxID=1288877 RepID=A0A3B0IZ55_9RICK